MKFKLKRSPFLSFILIIVAATSIECSNAFAQFGPPQEEDTPKDFGDALIDDIALTPGENEGIMNFAWYSMAYDEETEEGVDADYVEFIQIAPLKDVKPEKCKGNKPAMDMSRPDCGCDEDGFPVKKSEKYIAQTLDISDEVEGCLTNMLTVGRLKKNSEYIYRIGIESEDEIVFLSDVYSFKTGDGKHGYSFLAVGDPQIGSSRDAESDGAGWQNTMDAALEMYQDVDFMVSVGDQVESASSEEQYTYFFDGFDSTSLPLATAVGNHENGSRNYFYHFYNPNAEFDTSDDESADDASYTADANGDYYFIYSDTLFIFLNSNADEDSHGTFLQNVVSEHQDLKWKIVSFHHSIFSSASHAEDTNIVGGVDGRSGETYEGLRNIFTPLFEELDIDLVLMGHDHCYTRTFQIAWSEEDGSYEILDAQTADDGLTSVMNPEGTLYITLNSGSGSKYYTMKDKDYDYEAVAYQPENPMFSALIVDKDSLTIDTYEITSDSETGDEEVVPADSYTLQKDRGRKDKKHARKNNRPK